MADTGTLGAISTVLMLFAIVGVGWWAFSPRRKKRFDDASQVPFAEDPNDNPGDRNANPDSSEQSADKRRN